jgi:transcriptional regulator with XRE-family HTH domain
MLSAAKPICQAKLGDKVKLTFNNPEMTEGLASRIKEVRTGANKTQEEFGASLGVSKAAVAQWETLHGKQRTEPKLEKLLSMASLYSVDLVWLLTGQRVSGPHVLHEPVAPYAPHDPLGDLFLRLSSTPRERRLLFASEWSALLLAPDSPELQLSVRRCLEAALPA